MSEDKQETAIKAIDEIIQNLQKPKATISYKDIVFFYKAIEETYDERIGVLESALETMVEDEEQIEKLKKISQLLNSNIK